MSAADSRQELGRAGEQLAARHLETRGYRILRRRYRAARGEVDLIAQGRGLLLFVEVKARRGARFGLPAEAVAPLKQARVAQAASHFLAAHPALAGTCRFDVIAITWPDDSAPSLTHIEDAFRLDR